MQKPWSMTQAILTGGALGGLLDIPSHIFLFSLPIVWATRKALRAS
jgi:hypothetical protein